MTWRLISRIAQWEVTKNIQSIDRRTAVMFGVILIGLGLLSPALVQSGVSPDQGIYLVAVDEDNQYYPVVRFANSLRAVDPETEKSVQIRITDSNIDISNTNKGKAAAIALRQATKTYNDYLMRDEPNKTAAFPVLITLQFIEQPNIPQPQPGQQDQAQQLPGTDTQIQTKQTATQQTLNQQDGDGSPQTNQPSGFGQVLQQTGNSLFGGNQIGTPSQIRPPFPLQSLLIAFIFILPLNIVIQAYGSSMINERINRRGEPLLVSPVRPRDIIIGKTIPYLIASAVIFTVIAYLVGGTVLSIIAMMPVAGVFLGATFFAAMVARSFKELTFLTVSISVFITSYVFVPAIFSNIHPIAAISPLTIVVRDLTNESISLSTGIFGTIPLTFAALILFSLGSGLYREETLFSQLPISEKLIDAFAAKMTSTKSVMLWSILVIPFVFIAEIFTISILFALPGSLSLPLLLTAIAIIEEVAKSIHIYAGFSRHKFKRKTRQAILLGTISGIGFAIGEKFSLLAQLVGLSQIQLAQVAFYGTLGPGFIVGAFLAPFLLHIVTTGISSYGARTSRSHYLIGIWIAILVHVIYNFVVVSAFV
ncbi:MAG: PrsW family intramembrane metalloprotease [Halobacteriaceae archaeon]